MKLRIYYSGEENLATPELTLGNNANVMLTYWNQQRNPHKRFRTLLKARKKKPTRKK